MEKGGLLASLIAENERLKRELEKLKKPPKEKK